MKIILTENYQSAYKKYVKGGKITEEELGQINGLIKNKQLVERYAAIFLILKDSDLGKYFFDTVIYLLNEYYSYTIKKLNIKELDEPSLNVQYLETKIDYFESLDKILKKRKNVFLDLSKLPSIYYRNIIKVIPEKIKLILLDAELEKIKTLLSLVNLYMDYENNTLAEKILNTALSSKINDIESMYYHLMNNFDDINFNPHKSTNEVLEVIQDDDEIEENTEILYNKNKILIIAVHDHDALRKLTCNTKWCFSRSGSGLHWDKYAEGSFVILKYDFNYDALDVFLPNGDVYDSDNQQLDDNDGNNLSAVKVLSEYLSDKQLKDFYPIEEKANLEALAEFFFYHFDIDTNLQVFKNEFVKVVDGQIKFDDKTEYTSDLDDTMQSEINKFFKSKKLKTSEFIKFVEGYYNGFAFNIRHTGKDLFGEISTTIIKEPVYEVMNELAEIGVPIVLGESKRFIISESQLKLLNSPSTKILLKEETTPYKKKVIDPALMTKREYFDYFNDENKFHPSTAYHTTYKGNKGRDRLTKSIYNILVNRIKVNNRYFELRIEKEPIEYSLSDEKGNYIDRMNVTEIKALKLPTESISVGLFDEYGVCVGYAQDEWNTVLVTVVEEYRGWGFGDILMKEYTKHYPTKDSGGYTNAGYKTAERYYYNRVREYLANGFYSLLVKRGQITKEKVKEIVSQLPKHSEQRKIEDVDLNFNDPKDMLVMDLNNGEFILYNKKLYDLIENEKHEDFIEDCFLGHVRLLWNEHKNEWRVQIFYSQSSYYTKFLNYLLASFLKNDGNKLKVDGDLFEKYIDKTLYKGNDVVVKAIKGGLDYNLLNKLEVTTRKNHFKNQPYRADEVYDIIIEKMYGISED